MPRPGPRREPVPLRLSGEERRPVDELASQETDGNVSEMIRKLIKEAIEARQAKKRR